MQHRLLCVELLLFLLAVYCLVFPLGCNSFRGAHAVECLVTLWLDSGCVEQGWLYPKTLDERQLSKWDKLNLQ